MKMVFIVYNSALEEKISECLSRCELEYYTKFPTLHGRGEISGPHLGTHIWPATNSALLVACEDGKISQILEEVKKLRNSFEKKGIKAFVMVLEDVV